MTECCTLQGDISQCVTAPLVLVSSSAGQRTSLTGQRATAQAALRNRQQTAHSSDQTGHSDPGCPTHRSRDAIPIGYISRAAAGDTGNSTNR